MLIVVDIKCKGRASAADVTRQRRDTEKRDEIKF